MPDLKDIYDRQADVYDELVAREDYQHNLIAAINRVRPATGLDVVELGAGTGRLTCMLAPVAKSVRAFDASPAMLAVAAAKLMATTETAVATTGTAVATTGTAVATTGTAVAATKTARAAKPSAAAKPQGSRVANWQLRVADHGRLPLPDGVADLALAGWSLCYAALDHPDRWRETLAQALGEMQRVLRPGGTCLIIETLGTGFETPHPPDALKDYLNYLVEAGFHSEWIRTDYEFESLAEAERLIQFFFGDELAAQTVREQWQILPECTGLWWK
jgi:ubiquinone/menaquinone biosynthesis C-methylase UbiE